MKTGVSQCAHCQVIYKPKQMEPSLKQAYKEAKAKTKTPLWTFSGIAIVAALVALGIYASKENDEKNISYLQNFKKNDILEIKDNDTTYTLAKIDSVTKDSVFVKFNFYETNMESGLEEMKEKGDSVYHPDIFALGKAELKAMYDKGELINITRE